MTRGRTRRNTVTVVGWTRLAAGLWACVFTAAAVVSLGTAVFAQTAPSPVVTTTTIDGPITPVVAQHLADVVTAAEVDGDAAVLIALDTPGGLVSSMKDIVQTFFAADVPVIVYVSPSGADAGSAGTFITMAAHVAAMSPASTIGAATPVDINGGEVGDKIVNNAAAYAEAVAENRGRDVDFAVGAVRDGESITADEALERGAVDLIAEDVATLLREVDGTEVEIASGTITLDTDIVTLRPREITGTRAILQLLANPNLAFIFSSLGVIAIIYEIASPGTGAGGVVGAVCLILLLFSVQALPVNVAGLALVAVAGAMFTAELFAPGIGIGAAGGAVALALGGVFLIDASSGLGVSKGLIAGVALVILLLAIAAGRIASSVRNQTPFEDEGFIGRTGTLVAGGRLRLDGASWEVVDADGHAFGAGQKIEVIGRDELKLIARPIGQGSAAETAHPTDL